MFNQYECTNVSKSKICIWGSIKDFKSLIFKNCGAGEY